MKLIQKIHHKKIQNQVNEQLDKISQLVDENYTVNSTYNIQPGSSHSDCRSYNNCYIMQTVPVVGADLGAQVGNHDKLFQNVLASRA